MEIEKKLDEDFIFYFRFTDANLKRLNDPQDKNIADIWLTKLCTDPFKTIDEKRERNLYLCKLICCIENGELEEPFTQFPPDKLHNAFNLFGKIPLDLKEPEWLNDIVQGGGDDFMTESRDGRTYLATKTLPDNEGAFGYVAVSLADGEPHWNKQQQLEKYMERKYFELNPPMSDMEKIMILRKNPAERDRVMNFYEELINNIKKEIEGSAASGIFEPINELITQLVADMEKRGMYEKYAEMPAEMRRLELLYILDDRLRARRDRVARREEILDDIEEKVKPGDFWDTSLKPEDVHKEDKKAYAIQMWEEAIGKGPKKKIINTLEIKYPEILFKKFLLLLAKEKEKIAIRCQRRHENIVSQLKKELRKEGERGKKKLEEVKTKGEAIISVVDQVKAAHQKALESYTAREEMLTGGRRERDEMYQQMKEALLETQHNVEEEAERGRLLTQQIRDVTAQTQVYQQVTEDSIRNIEDANIALMKNISRIGVAIKQYETRLKQIKEMGKTGKTKTGTGSEFFLM